MVVVGDDQREIFSDDCRPAIAVYYGDSIRNAPAPADPTDSWYLQDQRKRMEDKHERLYPCNAALGTYFATGLTDRGFDITAMKSLTGEQFEGHAYSFIHRRFMPKKPDPHRSGNLEHLLSTQPAEPSAVLRSRCRAPRTRLQFPGGPTRRHHGVGRTQPFFGERGARPPGC